jgi:hypothetical protein
MKNSDVPDPYPELDNKALRDLGGHYMRNNTLLDAIKCFQTVYERIPHNWIAIGELARAIVLAGDMDALDALAKDVDLHAFDEQRPKFLHDLTPLERRIQVEVCSMSCQSPEAIAQLSRSVRYVIDNDIPGDFVECGVYKGTSIICIIRTLQDLGVTDRRIWLYDTFDGMPEPDTVVDVFYDAFETNESVHKTWETFKRDDGGSDWVRSPIDEVRANLAITGYPEDNLVFAKGIVEDTIPASMPKKIALLRLDTDFYRSTKQELEHLYPLLSINAPLIIDDYGAFAGAKKATDEYFAEHGPFMLHRIDEHVRAGIKLSRLEKFLFHSLRKFKKKTFLKFLLPKVLMQCPL